MAHRRTRWRDGPSTRSRAHRQNNAVTGPNEGRQSNGEILYLETLAEGVGFETGVRWCLSGPMDELAHCMPRPAGAPDRIAGVMVRWCDVVAKNSAPSFGITKITSWIFWPAYL
jgi:hypothetical protein